MKKFILLGLAIMMAVLTLVLQGCNNTEAQQPTSTTPTIAINTVGWEGLALDDQLKIVAMGKAHEPGSKIELNPPMNEVVSVTYLYDVSSSLKGGDKQTLLTYKFRDGNREGNNEILILGHLDGISRLESLPDVLNNSNCCYKYGGCIVEYSCPQIPPVGKECKPCEQPTKAECEPCKQGKSPGKKQGDGVSQEAAANGNDHKIISTW